MDIVEEAETIIEKLDDALSVLTPLPQETSDGARLNYHGVKALGVVCGCVKVVHKLVAEVKRLRKEVENHRANHASFVKQAADAMQIAQRDIDVLKSRNAIRNTALREALTEFRDALPYVPDYFREKWGYDETIERLSAMLWQETKSP